MGVVGETIVPKQQQHHDEQQAHRIGARLAEINRADVLFDAGKSPNPAIDIGQIEGAFVQGQGLFTTEESLWLQNGQIFTRGPGAYKIPSALYAIRSIALISGTSLKTSE